MVISLRNSYFPSLEYAYDILNISDIFTLNMLIHFMLIKNRCISIKKQIIIPKFRFRFVSLNKILGGVNKLNHKNPSQATDRQVYIIKENKDVVSIYVFHNVSNLLSSCSFPTELKYANVWPVF